MRWLLVMLVGCYSPTPPAGAPCGANDTCPSGLACTGGLCLVPGAESDGPVADASTDSSTPDACVTFASQLDTCGIAAGGDLVLSGTSTYNTDTHQLTSLMGAIDITTVQVATSTGLLDLIVVSDFTLSGTLRVIGDAPFGIVAFGSINVTGEIDASAGGAGARGRTDCATAAGGIGTTNAPGSSGGGGGALRGKGGAGGKGDTNDVPVDGAPGGDAISLPTGLLGGCPGGKGGGDMNQAGAAGEGGGAVYLVASGLINVNGAITVGGAGGGHGHPISGGGGGGGSGGMIVIEASAVNVNGTLAANGGGGGGGADDVAGNEGVDGETGKRSSVRAKGGAGFLVEGGDGGDGGAGLATSGADSVDTADNGGGGGGGGCGFIAIGAASMATGGATISPALSPWPAP